MEVPLRPQHSISDSSTRTTTSSLMDAIEVVLAGRRVEYRRAVRQALEGQDKQCISVLGEAGSLSELGYLLAETRPKVIILDPQLPDTLGLDAITHISQAYPDISIVVLTTLMDTRIMKEAVMAGAQSCLIKEISTERFVSAIQLAARAKLPVPKSEHDRDCDRAACGDLTTRPLFFTTQKLC